MIEIDLARFIFEIVLTITNVGRQGANDIRSVLFVFAGLSTQRIPSFNRFVVDSITCSGSGIFSLLFCISAASVLLRAKLVDASCNG